MPRARSGKPRSRSQLESDASDVLEFLRKFPCTEFSRSDIARGCGIPDNHRIGPAVCVARAAAARDGARVEVYRQSKDPARNRTPTLRYIPAGKGDADGAEDALRTSRSAITRLEDAHRACDFASKNRHIALSAEYAQVGNAFGACLSTVSSIHELNEKLCHANNEKLRLAKLVAEYEAQRGAPGLSIVSDLP